MATKPQGYDRSRVVNRMGNRVEQTKYYAKPEVVVIGAMALL